MSISPQKTHNKKPLFLRKKTWVLKCHIKVLSPEIIFMISEKYKSIQFSLRCTCKTYANLFCEKLIAQNAWGYNEMDTITYNRWLLSCNLQRGLQTIQTACEIGNSNFFKYFIHDWLHHFSFVTIQLAIHKHFDILEDVIHCKIGTTLLSLTTTFPFADKKFIMNFYEQKNYYDVYYRADMGDFTPYISDEVYDIVVQSENEQIIKFMDSINIVDKILIRRLGFLGKTDIMKNHKCVLLKPFIEGCIMSGRLELAKDYIPIYVRAIFNYNDAIQNFTEFMKYACKSPGIQMLEYIYSNYPTDKTKFKTLCIIKDDEKQKWFESHDLHYFRI